MELVNKSFLPPPTKKIVCREEGRVHGSIMQMSSRHYGNLENKRDFLEEGPFKPMGHGADLQRQNPETYKLIGSGRVPMGNQG